MLHSAACQFITLVFSDIICHTLLAKCLYHDAFRNIERYSWLLSLCFILKKRKGLGFLLWPKKLSPCCCCFMACCWHGQLPVSGNATFPFLLSGHRRTTAGKMVFSVKATQTQSVQQYCPTKAEKQFIGDNKEILTTVQNSI